MSDDALCMEHNGYTLNKVTLAASILKAWVTADKCLTNRQRMTLGHDINIMLVSCYFNNEPCNARHFTRLPWHNEYGNCYTFNALYDNNGSVQESKRTSKPGIRNGLSVELISGITCK